MAVPSSEPKLLPVLRRVGFSWNNGNFPSLNFKPLQMKCFEYMLKDQDVIGVFRKSMNALSPSTSFHSCEDHQEHSYRVMSIKFHHRRSAESLKSSEANRWCLTAWCKREGTGRKLVRKWTRTNEHDKISSRCNEWQHFNCIRPSRGSVKRGRSRAIGKQSLPGQCCCLHFWWSSLCWTMPGW